MLEGLEQAIEAAPIGPDRDTLVDGFRLLDRLAARLADAVGEFDRAGLWDLDDATSMAAWLRVHADRSGADAARLVRVAGLVRRLPVTAGAWRDGTLSGAQVDTIATHLPRRHVERFAAVEADLVPVRAGCDAAGTAVALRAWRAAADDADPGPEPDEPVQSLHVTDINGRGVVRGDLAPDTHAVVGEALAVADSGDLDRRPAQRRAEALDVVCRFFLAHHDTDRHPRRRPRIAVVVRPEELATGRYGLEVCDAAVHRLLTSGPSVVIDYGRATRVVSAHQRDLLHQRDRHCRWPGCDRPAGWCDAHHVTPWEHGGPTSLDNLVLLCRRHHRRLHRAGYRAKLLPDATFETTRPDGRTDRTEPPGLLTTTPPFW
jgi:hypothetical protein